MALNALDEPQPAPLDPETEQRLHALLAKRVAPLLLRCLQTWEGGAGASPAVMCRSVAAAPPCFTVPADEAVRVQGVLRTGALGGA